MDPSVFPTYSLVEAKPENVHVSISVLTPQECQKVPESHRGKFKSHGETSICTQDSSFYYLTPCKVSKHTISKDSYIEFSEAVSTRTNYYGMATDLLSFHRYSRKTNKNTPLKVYLNKDIKDVEYLLALTQARNQNKEHCNGRGDVEGVPAFFEKLAADFAAEHALPITIIKGDDLLKDGFRLMHAVGRASKNAPTFINIGYNGNPDSDKWVSFVGKGVCFDSGGLNIKPTSSIHDMFLDKCGAVGVFSAFQYIVKQKIKINLTVSMGFVENFLASTAYRPSDIIESRKGISVEIGNTDAEGRLVLADCMHWTQQKYKTEVMIELSTLTGAIIVALGSRFAGLFTNSEELKNDLIAAGKAVNEECWNLPIVDYHRDLIKHKFADITNSSGKSEAGSSQAAAFLEHFVEQGTKWIHLDIAGTAMVGGEGTGFGARLLIQYARNYASK